MGRGSRRKGNDSEGRQEERGRKMGRGSTRKGNDLEGREEIELGMIARMKGEQSMKEWKGNKGERYDYEEFHFLHGTNQPKKAW